LGDMICLFNRRGGVPKQKDPDMLIEGKGGRRRTFR